MKTEMAAEIKAQQEPVAKYIGECSEGSLVHLYDDVKKGTNFYTPPQPEQKRPQNCGTGYCSCIECVMKPSPRAWLIEFENGDEELHFDEQSVGETHVPLYTAPPQRPWVDLTDEEIQAIAKQARSKDHAVTLTNKFLRDKNT